MDQISMPFRIALAGLLVLVLAWFAVLRPKADDGASPAPAPVTAKAPGVTGLGRAIDKANGAVATSQASAARVEAAAGQATGGAAAPAPAAKPVAAPAAAPRAAAKAATAARHEAVPTDSSGPVMAALDRGRVAVVLFSTSAGADDAHVRSVLRHVDRHHGKVAVYSAPIGKVGHYSAITRGVQVMQGPTLLVIGRDRKARTIVGYTDVGEVQQLVDDVGRFRA